LWFPLWVDKWIFGSTRIECTLEERAIWIDFLALASKDNGYIRANETIAYPLELLAGLLFIPLEILKKAIKKFEETGKIRIDQNGSIYVISWNEYQLSNSYKRVIKHRVTKLKIQKPRTLRPLLCAMAAGIRPIKTAIIGISILFSSCFCESLKITR